MISRVPEPVSRSSQVAWRSACSEIGRLRERARIGLPCGRRQAVPKPGENARQQIVANGRARANTQRADLRFAIQRPALDPARAIEQGQSLRQQCAAVVVELQALADPVEQLQFKPPLQLNDGGAGRGLGQRDRRGGSSGAAAFGYEPENLQLTQGETQTGHGSMRPNLTYLIG